MAGNIKVWGLFYCFPYEGQDLDSLWKTHEEAEAARKKRGRESTGKCKKSR